MDCFLGFDASMLLGALIDAGANPKEIEMQFLSNGTEVKLEVKEVERSSIICKKVTAQKINQNSELYDTDIEFLKDVFKDCNDEKYTNPITAQAVIYALHQLNTDYIISSEVCLKEDIDGEVISILDAAGIEIIPADTMTRAMTVCDAKFLSKITNESGPKPHMDIISIGYGAGGTDALVPDIINVFLGENDSNCLFESGATEELIASL